MKRRDKSSVDTTPTHRYMQYCAGSPLRTTSCAADVFIKGSILQICLTVEGSDMCHYYMNPEKNKTQINTTSGWYCHCSFPERSPYRKQWRPLEAGCVLAIVDWQYKNISSTAACPKGSAKIPFFIFSPIGNKLKIVRSHPVASSDIRISFKSLFLSFP